MSSGDGCSVSGARKRLKISRNDVPTVVAPSSAHIEPPTPISTMKSSEATPNGNTIEPTNNVHASGTLCHHEQALKNMTVDVDAMRTLLTCQVCHRLMYQPFSLTCGHSFCYTCIDQWMHHKKECPGCRTRVTEEPTPSIVLRELVLIFASRNQLLEDGETADEHDKLAKEEREVVSKDEANTHARTGGRFKGLFRKRKQPEALRDASDGIQRCPDCLWELRHGACEQCGFDLHLDSDEEDEDDELDAELEDEDDPAAIGLQGLSDFESDTSDNGSDVHINDFNHHFGINRFGNPGFLSAAHLHPHVAAGAHRHHRYGPRDGQTVVEIISDDDDEDEEDDEADGSEMENFIVDDDDDDVEDRTAMSGDDDDDDDDDDDETVGDQTPIRRAYVDLSNIDGADSDDDSDEGPVASQRARNGRAGRMPHRHRVIEDLSEDESSEDDSGAGIPSSVPAPFSPLQGEVDDWGDAIGGGHDGEDNEDEDDVNDVDEVDDEDEESSEEGLDVHEDLDADNVDDDDEDDDEDVY